MLCCSNPKKKFLQEKAVEATKQPYKPYKPGGLVSNPAHRTTTPNYIQVQVRYLYMYNITRDDALGDDEI
jgi:hypothetical protein